MATKITISNLPATSSSSGVDEFVLVQSSLTKKITNTNLFTSVTLTSPTMVTPTLGVASATSINKVAITAPATSATLTLADGKTLTVNNSITFSGTDATTMTLPTTSATLARTDAAQTFTGTQTFGGAVVGSVQALSGPGAVNVTTLTTAFTSTGTGDALTLSDGVAGQLKSIVYVAEAAGADTGVLTPSNFGNGTTITFTNVGDSCLLQFLGTDWWVVSLNGATVA